MSRQREAIKVLSDISSSSPAFTKWRRVTEIAIERIFGTQSRNLTDFKDVRYSLSILTTSTPKSDFVRAYRRGLDNAAAVLSSMIDEIQGYRPEDDVPE